MRRDLDFVPPAEAGNGVAGKRRDDVAAPPVEVDGAGSTGSTGERGDDEPGADVPEFLSVEETAELLRVHRKTVGAMVRRGELPGVRRCGRTYRIHRASVISWFAASPRSSRRGGRP